MKKYILGMIAAAMLSGAAMAQEEYDGLSPGRRIRV